LAEDAEAADAARAVEATKVCEAADSARRVESRASSSNGPTTTLAACSIPLLHIACLLAILVLQSPGTQTNASTVAISEILFQEVPPLQSIEPVALFQ